MLFRKTSRIVLFYSIAVLFLLLNFYFVVCQETLLLSLLPFVLAVVLTAFVRMDRLLLLVAFLTPLSLPLHDLVEGLSFDMYLPTEPLLFCVLLLFLFQLARRRTFDRRLLKHPVSLALYFYLGWMLLTSLTSSMPIVSLKFWLSKLWFLAAFYFLGFLLFQKKENIYRFVGLYSSAFVLVIFYAWSRHFALGFNNVQAAHFVMNPFYKDHTSYGAMLAFFIPILLGITLFKGYRKRFRLLAALALLLFSAALLLSYSRAAWLSLAAAAVVWGILRLRIRFRPLLITGLTTVALIFIFQTELLNLLESNDQESSTNLMTHISSMTNVSSDASNLERINRWSCAVRMFEEKPFWGWGPGTYMFQYAPFQLTRHRTIISTNSANRGNAHSEYLGPLAESGFLGLLSFLMLASAVLYAGVHAYTRASDKEIRLLILSTMLGLVTYLVHGTLNNFLDTDKVGVPFWAFVVILVVLDWKTKEQRNELSAK
ncbi:O-antigen ligase family protein [Sunxiuqinia sp. sy24]|uniref:O-antigen ligase family protein n=1 Tax=Sunxiuqinia sp. sy24 TaxID=3461495 RepID=UPI004045BF58